jgi:hypothetical protein
LTSPQLGEGARQVSADEQTRRLKSRMNDPRKIWKLSDMDLKSYRRWDDYSSPSGSSPAGALLFSGCPATIDDGFGSAGFGAMASTWAFASVDFLRGWVTSTRRSNFRPGPCWRKTVCDD